MKTPITNDFFKVGGALDPDAPSYVTRQADDELLQAILSGQYCNVLTARQMGKSSLMVRTVRRLQDEGVRTVTIDLNGLGTDLGASEWYFGLVSRFKRQLGLRVDEITWWSERDQLGPVQRFSDFLRQVVLEEVREPIVVFIDEIDSTLNLPFTDDFFAAIRAAYNARASDPAYKRITFVLLGVARPSDLIKDRTRTPFNIGTSIDLNDFTPEEARVLLTGLEAAYPEQAGPILERVLHWTCGHPYLTQKVCANVSAGNGHWTDGLIDDLVRQLFLTEEARKETNLQFIRDRVGESRERGGMLRVYRRVLAGKRVQDEERSVVKSQLKLTGLVKATSDGALLVRNPIYKRVFDKQWVKENVPLSPAQRLAVAMTAVAALAIIVMVALIYRQQTLPDDVRADLYRDNFLSATSPDVCLNNLAGLFGLRGYEDEARDRFFGLDAGQQLAMFEGLENPQQVGRDVLVVVEEVCQDQRLENSAEPDRLLQTMAGVLHQVKGAGVPGAEVTAMEIDYWVEGRERATEGEFAAAVDQYTLALGLNEENVAVLIDRGRAYAALDEYADSLADLQEVVELDKAREEAVQRSVNQDPGLFTYVGLHRQEYQAVAALFPTLTPTSTPTDTPTPTNTPTPTPTPTSTPTSTPLPLRNIPIPLDRFGNDDVRNILPGFPIGIVTLGDVSFAISDGNNKISTQCDKDEQREWPTIISVPVGDLHGAESVYVLINAGYGRTRYEGAEIGFVVLEFDDGRFLRFPLILGKNIREWSIEASDSVVTAPGSSVVWSGLNYAGRSAVLDMLTISIPQDYRSSSLHTITFYDTSQETLDGDLNPCFFIVGITVDARGLPSLTLQPISTATPRPIVPEPVAPAQGDTYQSPVTFQWHGSLSAGQVYQVTAYCLESGHTVQSGLLTDQSWTVGLPGDKYGSGAGQCRWCKAGVR